MNEIQKFTDVESWTFCPGEKTPADKPIPGPDLARTHTWSNGAEFLKSPKENWPFEPENTEIDENEANLEVMKQKAPSMITRSLTCVSKTVASPNIEVVIDCNRYSSKTGLLQVTARVRRFINNIRSCRVESGELTVDELTAAEKLWVRLIQAASFEDEVRCLSRINKKDTTILVDNMSHTYNQKI